jgi:hypothetical protein
MLKLFYFHILSIAKIGYIVLWMIATLATLEKWKKKHYDSFGPYLKGTVP